MEDEPAIRVAMKRALKRANHEVGVAANLSEARDLVKSFQPEFFLSDLKLPDGSGLDLAGELAIPFILMSGYADFDDAVAALRLGCVDFFTKPVTVDAILARIAGHVARLDQGQISCIDSEHGVNIVQAQADAFMVGEVEVKSCTWSNQDEASKAHSELNLESATQRQVVAEMMQCSASGRLVFNQSADRWSAWLDQKVLCSDPNLEEHLQFIRQTADNCICRSNGIMVEHFDAN